MGEYVRGRGEASVAVLSDAFGVSADTVRRDLLKLENLGVLTRTHGGAVAMAQPTAELHSVTERQTRHLASKQAIGAAAARLVVDGETVLINGGSTTLEVARALGAHPGVALVTCSPQVVLAVAEQPGRGVHLLGGRWYPEFGVVVGPVALPGTLGLRADRLVMGVAGITPAGVSIANVEEAAMISSMIDSARRVVVVADASKFDRDAFAVLADLSRIDTLVTDRTPDGDLARALADADVAVVVAPRA